MNTIEPNKPRFYFSIDDTRSDTSEAPSSIAASITESNETVNSPISTSTADFAAQNQADSLAQKLKRFFCCA